MKEKMSNWPVDVGILAVEIYFPCHYVDQAELEEFDGASTGKYTIGLGQTTMAFCTDREDVHSLCLTVVERLMEKHRISYTDIGRLEVGTETLVDKSKSVKTVLMQLFERSGNSDVEGVDSTNACYGGTAALFNCANWLESSAWDGRYALMVASDIAVYPRGNARCTGGAGAVAFLLGPNAPLILERGTRSTHMQHAYDFYKPNMTSEYPLVDGKLSAACYLVALDKCYKLYKKKYYAKHSKSFTVFQADAFLFHTPYCKLVQKSFARLVMNDVVDGQHNNWPSLESHKDVELSETFFNKEIEKAAMKASLKMFEEKTKPSLNLSTRIGNMYTASLYGALISFLISHSAEKLIGKRIVLFSYGSGLSSTMFSIRVGDKMNQLKRLYTGISDVVSRLDSRTKIDPAVFDEIMALREITCHTAPHSPVADVAAFFPGTWYLTNIDETYRRKYERKPLDGTDSDQSKTSLRLL
ncbi:DgyrCDS11327 [Dimorphilus gyrociliatus]|uniref:Hydroxymethylglutaryl-CoA synthase n=1 Tax=Dimorphilus gyrociliatus TaxID=2664684 RepID=A0A7I8W350_9ANNE|nr:DgyrCDS11327 [Dimorphilus gyrociliatus]